MKSKKIGIGILCIAIILLFAAVIAIPATNAVFTDLTNGHPFIMGFVKFAFLATCGEIIAKRLKSGAWSFPSMLWLRFLIWGALGAWITFMMKTLGVGIGGMIKDGLVWNVKEEGFWQDLIRSFCISATMNTTFGPTFMALHKITDTAIELKANGKPHKLMETVKAVDWSQFVSFTVLKCVPFFWIPAHTVVFMLPAEYQVVVAAFLSIALGILLSIKKSK